ncbi:MAG: NAD(P)/FAD-dependent oxidoreductase [Pseudomonadota bacterium]
MANDQIDDDAASKTSGRDAAGPEGSSSGTSAAAPSKQEGAEPVKLAEQRLRPKQSSARTKPRRPSSTAPPAEATARAAADKAHLLDLVREKKRREHARDLGAEAKAPGAPLTEAAPSEPKRWLERPLPETFPEGRSAEGLSIGVVGGGIGGLAAALFLARRGAAVTVMERSKKPEPAGAGFLLQPTGLAVLSALGLYDEVRRHGARIDRLVGKDWRGREVMDLAYARFDPRLHALGVHRGVVFEALRRAAEAAGVEFLYNTEALGGALRDKAAVLATDRGLSAQYDYVIVADGARSRLRSALGLAKRERPYRWACVWRVAPDPGDLLSGAVGRVLDQRYDGARRMAGILPVGQAPDDDRPHAALFWSLPAEAHAAFKEGGRDAWLRELQSFWPRFAEFVAEAPWEEPVLALYQDAVATRPYTGRVILIGDAAHAMSPQLGQGANLALLDAHALDCAFATVTRDAVPAAYASARRAQTAWYQRASRWLTPVFQSESTFWGAARDRLFKPMSQTPFFRDEMLAGQAGLKTGIFGRDRRDWTPGRPPPP